MRKKILYIAAAALMCACGGGPDSGKKDPTIDITDINPYMDSEPQDIGPLLEEMSLIPLETSEPCFMKDVVKVYLVGGRFFVATARLGLFIFDEGGRYVGKIAEGNGPGQLPHYCPLCIKHNPGDSLVYISNFGGLIHKYRQDGSFVETIYFGTEAFDIEFLDDGVAVATLENGQTHHLQKYSPGLKEKTFDAALNKCERGGVSLSIRKVDGNKVIYSNNDCDTSYLLSGSSLSPQSAVDYSERKLESGFASAMEIFTSPECTGKWQYMATNFQAGSYEMMRFTEIGELGTGSVRPFINKDFAVNTRSGKVIPFGEGAGGCLAGFPFASDGKYFYSVIYPEYREKDSEPDGILTPGDAAKWNSASPDDNIFIVKYRLRE